MKEIQDIKQRHNSALANEVHTICYQSYRTSSSVSCSCINILVGDLSCDAFPCVQGVINRST